MIGNAVLFAGSSANAKGQHANVGCVRFKPPERLKEGSGKPLHPDGT
jgi:hypothetical protein